MSRMKAWTRCVLAAVLTLLAIGLPFMAIAPGLKTSAEIDPGTLALPTVFGLVGIVVAILYFPFFWATSGQTPGMRPFGLHVVRDIDGSRLGWRTLASSGSSSTHAAGGSRT